MRLVALVTALVCLVPSGASALVVDQHNDGELPTGAWGIGNYPVGQEFRPEMDCFDAAEVYVWNMCDVPGPAELAMEVYEWEVTGALLSVSDTVSVAADYEGTVLFHFPAPVPLIYHATYVLVVYQVSGHCWGLATTVGNDYYWGRLIAWGEPQPWSDAWFREGMLTTPVEVESWAAIKSLYLDTGE